MANANSIRITGNNSTRWSRTWALLQAPDPIPRIVVDLSSSKETAVLGAVQLPNFTMLTSGRVQELRVRVGVATISTTTIEAITHSHSGGAAQGAIIMPEYGAAVGAACCNTQDLTLEDVLVLCPEFLRTILTHSGARLQNLRLISVRLGSREVLDSLSQIASSDIHLQELQVQTAQ
jgi:hypothetical protein